MVRSRLLDRGSEQIVMYPAVVQVDVDGNEIEFPSTVPVVRRCTPSSDRQSDAELPGQVTNKVVRVNVRDLPNVDSWAEIWFRGEQWDLAQPPHFSNGATRATEHVELLLRSRNSIPTPGGGRLG